MDWLRALDGRREGLKIGLVNFWVAWWFRLESMSLTNMCCIFHIVPPFLALLAHLANWQIDPKFYNAIWFMMLKFSFNFGLRYLVSTKNYTPWVTSLHPFIGDKYNLYSFFYEIIIGWLRDRFGIQVCMGVSVTYFKHVFKPFKPYFSWEGAKIAPPTQKLQ